jgi:indolepyruvate ferredoxin oxidoreductase, beta subunit
MKKLSSANVLICGVGGQGVLLFSDVLSQAAMVSGNDVKKSEVHGMAQRGGSVTSHVRFGPRVFSPLIEEGTADFLVAFEQLEALRYLHYLSPTGRVLIDTLQWKPMPVLIGTTEYPPDVIERVKAGAKHVSVVEAYNKAKELGQSRAQNIVMLGALSTMLAIPQETFEETIRQSVKAKFVDLNLRAFQEGRKLI